MASLQKRFLELEKAFSELKAENMELKAALTKLQATITKLTEENTTLTTENAKLTERLGLNSKIPQSLARKSCTNLRKTNRRVVELKVGSQVTRATQEKKLLQILSSK